jgi:hypothetical protein
MKIYINIHTGTATPSRTAATPLQKIEIKRGDLFELQCVFHAEGSPVELPAGSAAAFIVKKNQRYFEGPLLLAEEWAKQPAAGEGYIFTLVANTAPLNMALSDDDTITAMGEVTWQIGDNFRTTQKIPVLVANDIYKGNEPPPAPGETPWPLPETIALKSDVAAVQAQVDTLAGQMEGPRSHIDLVASDSSLWRMTLVAANGAVTPHFEALPAV